MPNPLKETKNCQKNIFADDQVLGHHPRALTVSQPVGGGGGAHCPPPPPPVLFLKYLKNALSYGLERFEHFKGTNCNTKNIFNRLRPPLVTIPTSTFDACFWKTLFGSFRAKAHQNSIDIFFCYVHEECPKLLWKFGLDIPLDGVLVTMIVSHSFSSFNHLK